MKEWNIERKREWDKNWEMEGGFGRRKIGKLNDLKSDILQNTYSR